MSYQNIAFIGKARSGKDTAGTRLVQNWNFTRLAFADPLKQMALGINPYVPIGDGVMVRLHALIADVGWEQAKDTHPEVRRVLQHMGQEVREYDEDFWLRVLMDKVKTADRWNMPVVVTDCRYQNEADALRAAGFILVRIKRNTGTAMTMREIREALAQHPSETDLDAYAADETVVNAGSIFDLHTAVDSLVRSR